VRDGEFSPLPITGIIDNIMNPYIVFMMLFDYFFIKGNRYIATGTLLSVVCRFYKYTELKALNKSKRFVNVPKRGYSSTFSLLYPFYFTLRQVFNLNTLDDQRSFLGRYTKNSEYSVPTSSAVIQEEISRVYKGALLGMVYNSIRKTNRLFDKIMKLAGLLGFTIETFVQLPIFVAIYNHIVSLVNISKGFSRDQLTLTEAVRTLLLLDIDAIAN
jgi:hypothetical protein